MWSDNFRCAFRKAGVFEGTDGEYMPRRIVLCVGFVCIMVALLGSPWVFIKYEGAINSWTLVRILHLCTFVYLALSIYFCWYLLRRLSFTYFALFCILFADCYTVCVVGNIGMYGATWIPTFVITMFALEIGVGILAGIGLILQRDIERN